MHSPRRALKKRRAALERERATEAERDDREARALRALRLKTVIRENHGAARDDARGVRARPREDVESVRDVRRERGDGVR